MNASDQITHWTADSPGDVRLFYANYPGRHAYAALWLRTSVEVPYDLEHFAKSVLECADALRLKAYTLPVSHRTTFAYDHQKPGCVVGIEVSFIADNSRIRMTGQPAVMHAWPWGDHDSYPESDL